MKTLAIFSLVLMAIFSTLANIQVVKDENDSHQRQGKLLPIFQVVRFPNDFCTGTSRNGTCYTAEECSTKGGTKDGNCASGFGVCCIFEMSCGKTSSENITYLVQSSSTTASTPCTYTICPCSSNICRIRYDFTTFVIASQTFGASNANTQTNVDSIGACTTDSFAISSPGKIGSPIICGTNTGYHMIVDVGDPLDCQRANFDIGTGVTTTSRSWDVKITQFACGDEDNGGPPGCLQYFTGTYGTIADYGFPPSDAEIDTNDASHLKNQNYEFCFRRESGYCYICYSASLAGTAAIDQISFGLSTPVVAITAVTGAIGSGCTSDYILIPAANTATIAALTTVTDRGFTRLCGRFLTIATDGTASLTVCSRTAPFRLGFVTNSDEDGTGTTAITNEQFGFPGGIIGFKLDWWQNAC